MTPENDDDLDATRVGCRSCQSPPGDPCRDRIGRLVRPHRTRVLDALGPQHALDQLRILTDCRCTVDWTARGLHDPACCSEYREDVDTLARCLFGADVVGAGEALSEP